MTSAPEELAGHALDNEEGRLKVAQIYNQVCRSMMRVINATHVAVIKVVCLIVLYIKIDMTLTSFGLTPHKYRYAEQ